MCVTSAKSLSLGSLSCLFFPQTQRVCHAQLRGLWAPRLCKHHRVRFLPRCSREVQTVMNKAPSPDGSVHSNFLFFLLLFLCWSWFVDCLTPNGIILNILIQLYGWQSPWLNGCLACLLVIPSLHSTAPHSRGWEPSQVTFSPWKYGISPIQQLYGRISIILFGVSLAQF